jgi:heptosyltransferase-2
MTPIKPAGSAGPLVVRIRNWIGDVVIGLPALQLLQAHGYNLHLVARGKWAPSLLAGYDWPVHVQPAGLQDKVRQLKQIRQQCKALDPRFDRRENALLLPVSLSSALEMRLAGLRAVGFAKEGRSPLMARAEKDAAQGHELTRYWALACQFLRVQAQPPADIGLRVAPAAALQAEALLAAQGVTGRFIMVCPFAAGLAATTYKAGKKWPEFGRFVAAAEQQLGLPLLVYPGPGEHAQARALYPAARCIDGGDLAIYAALLQRAALVVANDTGPAHMASALGRRVISVLGATYAERWAPWGPHVTVAQRPQAGESGETLWPTAEEVMAMAREQLA